MKKLFLFLLASVLSISVFAAGETGKTKAQAIPYDWNSGIHVSSEAGVGKWYVVMLKESDGGPFRADGKTADGKTDINVSVVNPLDQSAHINVIAYIGDNETSRDFTLAAGGSKSMTFGAGMFVRMGIDRVYLYLVMDVTVTEEEAVAHEAVNVNVEAVAANSVLFTPVQFDWTGFGTNTPATGNEIAANKETWLKVDWADHLTSGNTFKLYVKNLGSAATTIDGGLATDCPATSIQEQSKDIAAGATISKVLDPAMLDMMPDVIYIRLKAGQKLHVWAEQVAPVLPAQPLFKAGDANVVVKNTEYSLTDSIVYKVAYSTLQAPEYYYTQVEVTNNGAATVTLTGKVAKNASGDVFSAVSRTQTIQPGQTLKKELDKTLLSNIESGDEVYALVLGGNANVSFKLTDVCTEKDPCVPAEAVALTVPATGTVEKDQAANTVKWYAVNIAAAKTAKADIQLTMTSAETVDLAVDIAAACALGEPTQSYTGSSKSTTKTLSYSLFEHAGNVIYVRVNTNKNITVEAELLTTITWNGSSWNPNAPTANDAARIEGDLTIGNGETVKALGVTLAGGNVTIANGGKLIVGAEGIKGSDNVDQIVVEEGGILLISPEAGSNNKPFVTAKKTLHFGAADAGTRRAEKHEFIALPVDNREALAHVRYYGWDHGAGWIVDGFNKTFTGYDVYQTSAASEYYQEFTTSFKGQLADNKSQTLSMPGRGWHAFGNSWLAPMKVSEILANVGAAEAAVHVYVATPKVIGGTSYGSENDEKLYIPLTQEVANATGMTEVAAMEGFFLYTEGATSAQLNYNSFFSTRAAAPATREADNRNMVAAIVRGGNQNDFVYMIEGEAANAHKMQSNGLTIYAEDGLAQVANENLIGTILTIATNEATEYTLSFAWLKGETLYLQDMENGNIIAMTEGTTYTFSAEPNTESERFQVIGRKNTPTAIDNTELIEGTNKRIENGQLVIIKNGVKYNAMGAQL